MVSKHAFTRPWTQVVGDFPHLWRLDTEFLSLFRTVVAECGRGGEEGRLGALAVRLVEEGVLKPRLTTFENMQRKNMQTAQPDLNPWRPVFEMTEFPLHQTNHLVTRSFSHFLRISNNLISPQEGFEPGSQSGKQNESTRTYSSYLLT